MYSALYSQKSLINFLGAVNMKFLAISASIPLIFSKSRTGKLISTLIPGSFFNDRFNFCLGVPAKITESFSGNVSEIVFSLRIAIYLLICLSRISRSEGNWKKINKEKIYISLC